MPSNGFHDLLAAMREDSAFNWETFLQANAAGRGGRVIIDARARGRGHVEVAYISENARTAAIKLI